MLATLLAVILATNEPPEAVRKAAATLVGSNFKVSTSAPKRDTVPGIAYNSVSNEWFVVWEHWYDDQPLDRDIRARRISSTGALLGSEIVIVQLTKDETSPRVAYSPTSQRYMIVWVHDGKDVKAKIVDNLGAQTVAPFYVDLYTPGTSTEPEIVWRKTQDDFFIAWSETRTGGGNYDLFGSLINTDGTIKRDNIILRDVTTANLHQAALAYNEDADEYFMAYDNGSDIFGFRIDGGVVYQLSDIALVSNAAGTQVDASIAFDSQDKEYLVAWEDNRNGNYDIFARKLTDLGVVTGGSAELRISSNPEQDPVVVYKKDANAYVVAWEEQTANGDWDIFARGVGANLSLGAIDRVSQPTQNPDTETSNEYNPAVALNTSTGEYLVVWQDGRSGVFDIWAQRATYAAPGAPNSPTDLGHSGNTTTSVTWTWTDNSTDETSFKVETEDHLVVATTGPNVTNVTEGNLSENAKYTRHIHAANANGDGSPPSPAHSAYTSVHDPVLADFSLTVISSSQINVTVTAPPNPTNDQTGVEIQRSPDGSAWTTVKAFSNAYTFSDTGLIGNFTYYYRIRFRNGDADATAYSASKNATTQSDAQAPAAPTGLAAAPGGAAGEITLAWNANTEADLKGYLVFRATVSGGPYTQLTTNPITATTYLDTGLMGGTTYYYVVRAVDWSLNQSGNSNEASATAPGAQQVPPAPFIATPAKKTNDSTPVIAGTAVANVTIKVYFDGVFDGTTTSNSAGDWTYHNVGAAKSDGVYPVTAKASNAAGDSAASNSVSITVDTTPPDVPANLVATPRDGAIELAWTASTAGDLLGYNIYRKAPGEQNFTKINAQVVIGTQYRDTGLTNGQNYAYKVTAVDNALNEAH